VSSALLSPLDGSACLETFLLQFKYLASYMHWEEQDRFHHMCASLDGPAVHVLWELPPVNPTTSDLERLLHCSRRGSAHSYRQKVSRPNCECATERSANFARPVPRHQSSHPTRSCHRWWSWGIPYHPGEGDKLVKHIGVESFINVLNDHDLEYEIPGSGRSS